MYEQTLVRGLIPLVAAAAEGTDGGAPVVLRTYRRHRSTLYFVGLEGEGGRVRWVVKRPSPQRRQRDLRSPFTAQEQYDALVRLGTLLAVHDDTVTCPRPLVVLPDVEAFVMEYVPGRPLTDLLGFRAVRRPQELLRGVALAAEALRRIHVADAEPITADLWHAELQAVQDVRHILEDAGLPTRGAWVSPRTTRRTEVEAREVVLHGDWAPENVVLEGHSVSVLDPELADRGWPEHDVARFLLMLVDAPFFVTSARLARTDQLRRRASAAFLDGYYDGEVSPLLRPVLLRALAARWATRDDDVVRRAPAGVRSRQLLLRHHYRAALDEVSHPDWPRALRRGGSLVGAG